MGRDRKLWLVMGFVICCMVLGMLISPKPAPVEEPAYWISDTVSDSEELRQRWETDGEIYVLYAASGRTSLEVYSSAGAFLYTIEFTDFSSGIPRLRCAGDLAYVQLRNDHVYAFRGREAVGHWDREQAEAEGYGLSWFQAVEEPAQTMPLWMAGVMLLLGVVLFSGIVLQMRQDWKQRMAEAPRLQ